MAPSNNGQFRPGNRRGKGRPAGSRNAASLALDEIAAGEAEGVLRKVLQQAQAGDMRAAELLLARVWPAKRGRPVRLNLPPVDTAAGVAAALGALVNAVAAGEVTPEEATPVGALLETKRKAIETAAGLEDAAQSPPVTFNVQFVTPAPRAAQEEHIDITATSQRELLGSNVAVLETRKS